MDVTFSQSLHFYMCLAALYFQRPAHPSSGVSFIYDKDLPVGCLWSGVNEKQ